MKDNEGLSEEESGGMKGKNGHERRKQTDVTRCYGRWDEGFLKR